MSEPDKVFSILRSRSDGRGPKLPQSRTEYQRQVGVVAGLWSLGSSCLHPWSSFGNRSGAASEFLDDLQFCHFVAASFYRCLSRCCRKVAVEIPSALQIALNSTISTRNSPRSILLIEDCVRCSLFASSTCVMPVSSRICLRQLRNSAYSLL